MRKDNFGNHRDWHAADILAALRKRGTSMAAVSRAAGLASNTLQNALYRPWPKGEWLIANELGMHPALIWPSRYNNTDQPRIPRKPVSTKSGVAHQKSKLKP